MDFKMDFETARELYEEATEDGSNFIVRGIALGVWYDLADTEEKKREVLEASSSGDQKEAGVIMACEGKLQEDRPL